MPLICRHGRFTADCTICAKDELPQAPAPRAKPRSRGGGGRAKGAGARAVAGPFGSAGPYEDDEGRYEVRLERVPGGLRLAEWAGGTLRRRAPRLPSSDLRDLVAGAVEGGALSGAEAEALSTAVEHEPAGGGASKGRSGELQEELRFEALEDGMVRIARWLLRPGTGWELQDAPVLLPAKRFAEAARAASGAAGATRPA